MNSSFRRKLAQNKLNTRPRRLSFFFFFNDPAPPEFPPFPPPPPFPSPPRRCHCRPPGGAFCRSRRSARPRRLRWCRPAAPPPAGRTRATPPPARPALEMTWWSLLSSTFRGNDDHSVGAARAVLARGPCILPHFHPSDVGGGGI